MALDDKLDVKIGDKVFILRDPDILSGDNNHNVAATGFISELEDKYAKLTPFVIGAPDGRFLFTDKNIANYPVNLVDQGSIITKNFGEHKDTIINKEIDYLKNPKNKRVNDYLELAENLKNTQ